MSQDAAAEVVLELRGVRKQFAVGARTLTALRSVSLAVGRGRVTGLIGPDGAGKTTLMRLAVGLLAPDEGRIAVLGRDVAREPQAIQASVGYMPQRFGLYEDLSVQENLDLYADLQGVPRAAREDRYGELMRMTGLARFTARLAGRLSGGMKQKLGLACTLVRPPRLLLLDEPTVGVDPVSRRELWQIVYRLVREESMTVLLSTAYLDEAERCDEIVLLHGGEILGQGRPADLKQPMRGRTFAISPPGGDKRACQKILSAAPGLLDAVIQADRVRIVVRAGAADPAAQLPAGFGPALVSPVEPRLEDAFVALLRERAPAEPAPERPAPARPGGRRRTAEPVIQVRGVNRRFGDFYAVRNATFDVAAGEVFGLLGPNGAGKSTTFRMLCGLLPASDGTLRVAGMDLRHAAAAARARIGYMSQKFSLYGNLSVRENLRFFGSAYDLSGRRQRERMDWALDQFELGAARRGDKPGPVARAQAAACDGLRPDARAGHPVPGRADLGRRSPGPAGILEPHQRARGGRRHHPGDDALHGGGRILRPARHHGRRRDPGPRSPGRDQAGPAHGRLPRADDGRRLHRPDRRPAKAPLRSMSAPSRMRLRGLVRKEFYQVLRDPSSIAIAFLMPVFLLLIFGYGISLDAEHVPVAVVVEQLDGEAAGLAARFAGSRYFSPVFMRDLGRAERMLMERRVSAIVHLQADFSRRLRRAGRRPHPGHRQRNRRQHGAPGDRLRAGGLADLARAARGGERREALALPLRIEQRVWFNSELRSRNFLVPGLIAIIMTLIGALLTALVMAREWERGTMEALLVTPVTMGEVLLGKLAALFPARPGRHGAVGRDGAVAVRRPAAGLGLAASRHLGAVPARGPGHGAAHLHGGKEPVRGRHGRHHHDLPARVPPLRLHLRHRQHAAGGPGDHAAPAGPLLRGVAADALSRRERLAA